MVSGNVCDGFELVRRPHNRRVVVEPLFQALSAVVAARCEWSCSQLRFERSERVVSSQITTSTPGMVAAIENRTQNVAKQP